MQIDWFTVGAQVLNFLILVVLLKRFLYQPVINAMDRREQALLQSQQQADNQSAEAGQQARAYQQKLQDMEQHKQQLLEQARQDAELEKEKILQQLRQQIAETDQRWRAEVEREKTTFVSEARQTIGAEILRLLGKVLADLANADLQQQVVNAFVHRLQNLAADEQHKLEAALAGETSTSLKLRSNFALPLAQQQQIIAAINGYVSTEIALETEISSELLCGLVLQVPGGELEWNMTSYLAEFEASLLKKLSAPATTG